LFGDEVKPMRRIPFASAALAAGLAVLLTGCAGETPTSPSNTGQGQNGGSCVVAIAMVATSQAPVVGTEVVVRAAVTRSGVAVPDGTSVQITTDLGIFAENLLPTVSKTTVAGVAEVTLFSNNPGAAHVKSAYDCATASITVTYSGAPNQGPYISSFQPQSGSCTGGDTVTISGGQFGNTVGAVYFGGAPGSIVSWANATIVVKTPIHTLKDPTKPEVVDLIVVASTGQTQAVKFTYFCVDPTQRVSIASMSPIAGSPGGGDAVTILGSHFGINTATTQVTFCGLPAQITAQSDNQISVTTPAHTLANPALSETCPVVVTRDLGLLSVQSATAPLGFTYRGSGATGACNTDPTFYVSSLTPNTGSPDGGTVVTITGNGFPTNPALLRVDFGGNPGTILGTPTSTVLQVSSPRRVLATPDVPETVDIVVTDLGSASQRCYRVSGAFIYTAKALDPSFYSMSPKTGPNDLSTPATIFGANFQFPMQVFMTGGTCGAQRVEAAVVNVAPTQITIQTPVAVGGNACLAGQLVDVIVLNPTTGKTASCAACFKYYSCPLAGNASPSIGSSTQSTTVVITGNNFAEPVVLNYRLLGASTPLASLTPTSVSNTSIIVTMPPLQNLIGGSLSCTNVDGFIDITFLGLTCTPSPLPVPFSYHADPPTLTGASPSNLNQDGSAFGGALGTPQTITVAGTNFQAPMTVTLIKDGVPVPNTPVNNASVSNPTSLSFPAPAVPNNSLNQQNCLPSGGTSITGLKYVPTSYGIRVTNTLTKCSVDLPNILVYNPTDPSCRAGLQIVTASLANGTVGLAYSWPVTASGGAGPPFTWTAVGLPANLTIDPATGNISGIPLAAGTSTVQINVVDAATNPATRLYTLQINP
jgi:hypothetical protein